MLTEHLKCSKVHITLINYIYVEVQATPNSARSCLTMLLFVMKINSFVHNGNNVMNNQGYLLVICKIMVTDPNHGGITIK